MRKLLIFCVFMTVSLSTVSGREKLTKNSDLSVQYYFHLDQDHNLESFYAEPCDTGVKFKLDSKPLKHLKFQAEIDANLDYTDIDEIWLRYRAPVFDYKLGTFKNEILAEDYISSKDALFAVENQIAQRLEYMGWYTKNATGVEIGNRDRKNFIEGSAHVFVNYSNHEINGTFSLLYPFVGKDSFLGVGGALFPYEYVKEYMSWYSTYTRDFYGAYSFFIGDFSYRNRFVYKLEATFGNNKNDPVGLIHFPGEDGESWFGGVDAQFGFPVRWNQLIWTPALNLSYLVYNLDKTDAYGLEFRIGNRIAWGDNLFFHWDWGRRFNRYYNRNDKGELDLTSTWEKLWAVSFQLRY